MSYFVLKTATKRNPSYTLHKGVQRLGLKLIPDVKEGSYCSMLIKALLGFEKLLGSTAEAVMHNCLERNEGCVGDRVCKCVWSLLVCFVFKETGEVHGHFSFGKS